MTEPHKIAEGALVLVCDAARALFLRNIGTAARPSLKTEQVLEAPHVGEVRDSDRPGRMPDHVAAGPGKGPRSAMEHPNYHRRDADAFAAEICRTLEVAHRRKPMKDLLIAAPPEMLGLIRKHIPHDIAPMVRSEIDKDLTGMPVERLTRVLTGT